MEDVYLKVGRRVRELRKGSGLTQQDLSEKAGISVAFLSFLETGRKKGSLLTYAKLAQSLNLSMDQLFKDLQPAPKKTVENKYSLKFDNLSLHESRAIYQLVRALKKRHI